MIGGAAVDWFTCPWWVHGGWSPSPGRSRSVWGRRRGPARGPSHHRRSGNKKGATSSTGTDRFNHGEVKHWSLSTTCLSPRPHLTRAQNTDRGKTGLAHTSTTTPWQVHKLSMNTKQTHRSRRDTSQPSPADTKPCFQRSSVLIQSQWGIWGVMLRSWEREEWETGSREERGGFVDFKWN